MLKVNEETLQSFFAPCFEKETLKVNSDDIRDFLKEIVGESNIFTYKEKVGTVVDKQNLDKRFIWVYK